VFGAIRRVTCFGKSNLLMETQTVLPKCFPDATLIIGNLFRAK
jgi:hypothetical protein